MEGNKSEGIDQELQIAYEQACYRLFEPPVLFKINEQNDALCQLLKKHNSSSAFFITAFNPGSKLYSLSENNKNQERLQQQLVRITSIFYKGQSECTKGTWPIEESFLVLNISKNQAIEIGKHFKQMAIVEINHTGLSGLLLC